MINLTIIIFIATVTLFGFGWWIGSVIFEKKARQINDSKTMKEYKKLFNI